jgi:lambda repressor-like predicted transcriptional regulator
MSDAKRGERSPWYRRDILATDVSELRKAGWSFRSIAVQLGASSSLIRSRVHGRAEG